MATFNLEFQKRRNKRRSHALSINNSSVEDIVNAVRYQMSLGDFTDGSFEISKVVENTVPSSPEVGTGENLETAPEVGTAQSAE